MLRTSRVHQKFSAYHVLEGTHEFKLLLFLPPGTRDTIFNTPETISSWRHRALDAWYMLITKENLYAITAVIA